MISKVLEAHEATSFFPKFSHNNISMELSRLKCFKTKNYNFPVLLDTNSEVARLYYAQAMPFSVILNKDGYIVYSHLGYMRGDELKVRDKISEMINQ